MKTIFHTVIDGHDIVQGFGDAAGFIDPIATAQKLGEAVIALPETVAMNNLKAQVIDLRSRAQLLGGKIADAMRQGDTATENALSAQATGLMGQAAQIEPDLVAAIGAFEEKRRALMDANAVYTNPPSYESLAKDDAVAPLQAAFASLAEGQVLRMDGKLLPDLRGRTYWTTDGKMWSKMAITLLGVPVPDGGLTEDSLTDAQRAQIAAQTEADRIAALTPDERAAEVQRATDAALSQAAQDRSKLEIAGDTTALAKSQAQYQSAVADISAKYGA